MKVETQILLNQKLFLPTKSLKTNQQYNTIVINIQNTVDYVSVEIMIILLELSQLCLV